MKVSNRPLRRLAWAAGVALVLTACGKEEPKPAPLKLVKVFVVGDSVQGSATPTAAQSFRDPSALSFDAAGRVIAVLAKEGDRVIAGQALARLDPRDLALSESSARTQLLAAQAELAAAEADFRRYSDLHAKGFISAAEHERRRAQIELARARFESTSDQLGYLTLRALEPGIVRQVRAREGDLVEPRQLLIRIDLAARSGTSTGAAVRASGLSIPIGALMEGGFVYRIQLAADGTGTLDRVAVKTGLLDERSAQVVSGLSPGDQIVAAGTHVLSPQERVRLK